MLSPSAVWAPLSASNAFVAVSMSMNSTKPLAVTSPAGLLTVQRYSMSVGNEVR